jgi:hypothetical protein
MPQCLRNVSVTAQTYIDGGAVLVYAVSKGLSIANFQPSGPHRWTSAVDP